MSKFFKMIWSGIKVTGFYIKITFEEVLSLMGLCFLIASGFGLKTGYPYVFSGEVSETIIWTWETISIVAGMAFLVLADIVIIFFVVIRSARNKKQMREQFNTIQKQATTLGAQYSEAQHLIDTLQEKLSLARSSLDRLVKYVKSIAPVDHEVVNAIVGNNIEPQEKTIEAPKSEKKGFLTRTARRFLPGPKK